MQKSKKQARQEKRLRAAKKQANRNKAELKKMPAKRPKQPIRKKQGGFLSSALTKAFGRADAPQTVQQTIPYQEMYRDGICRVTDRLYNKTIVFDDINYQLAQMLLVN